MANTETANISNAIHKAVLDQFKIEADKIKEEIIQNALKDYEDQIRKAMVNVSFRMTEWVRFHNDGRTVTIELVQPEKVFKNP